MRAFGKVGKVAGSFPAALLAALLSGCTLSARLQPQGADHCPATTLQRLKTTGPLVSFVSDDGTTADLRVLLPIFQARGVPATSAPISELVGQKGHMTAEQIQLLQQSGWEIASHSRTHVDLTTLRPSDLSAEIQGAQQELGQVVGQDVTTFVYPYGAHSPAVRDQTCRTYQAGVAAFFNDEGLNLPGDPSAYTLKRVALGSWTRPFQNTFPSYVGWVNRAAEQHAWLIFMLHPYHPEFNDVQQRYLGDLIDAIQARHIPIVTVREALRRLAGP